MSYDFSNFGKETWIFTFKVLYCNCCLKINYMVQFYVYHYWLIFIHQPYICYLITRLWRSKKGKRGDFNWNMLFFGATGLKKINRIGCCISWNRFSTECLATAYISLDLFILEKGHSFCVALKFKSLHRLISVLISFADEKGVGNDEKKSESQSIWIFISFFFYS